MPQKPSVSVFCKKCGIAFLAKKSDVVRGRSLFCGRSCASKYRGMPNEILGRSGENNPAWKGGLTKSKKGYWYVLQRDHPRAWKHGYVKRATLAAEKTLGRYLFDDEVVHHIDGNKGNDSSENLEVMTENEHRNFHGMLSTLSARVKVRNPEHPNNRRYIWPSDEELFLMRSEKSLREIARIIGCNHKAVDRRIKKIKTRGIV